MNERIQAIIEAEKLKKVEFARRLNLSQPFVSELCSGKSQPSDRTISDICREFNVNEDWLRTGEGEMFIRRSKSDEITSFVGSILQGEPDFRTRLISVLARMTPDEWDLLERKTYELMDELKKADP